MWISSCPNKKTNLSPIKLSWQSCQKPINHKYKGLSQECQFYFIDLNVYPMLVHTIFILNLCSRFWNWEVWVFQLCTVFPRLFWLPWWFRQWRICLQRRRSRFNPWVGRIPLRRKCQPTPVFLNGESYGQRSLVVCSPWGHKELDTTERVSLNHLAAVSAGRSVMTL